MSKILFKLQTTIIVGKVLSEHLFNKTLRFRLHFRLHSYMDKSIKIVVPHAFKDNYPFQKEKSSNSLLNKTNFSGLLHSISEHFTV